QPAATAGDLRRVEGEPLILGQLQADRLQLPEPCRAAQFASAPPDAAQERRLVANADLAKLDPGAKRSCQLADELAEIDAPLRREVDRELVPVELPLGLGDLHLEAELLHLLAGDLPDPLLVGAERTGLLDFLGAREPEDAARRDRCGAPR